MTLLDWPQPERPREKLCAQGSASLSDAELLAVLLGTGMRGQNVLDLSRQVLQRSGGLVGLFRMEEPALRQLPGMGRSRFALFQAALEVTRRVYFQELQAGGALTSPQAAERYLQVRLGGRTREVFGCLFLDTQHRVIGFEELFEGTLDSAAVYPREIARRALQLHAAAVILAHNHPSGLAEPSAADRRITDQVRDGLALLDIRVLDHLVVGQSRVVSFARRGWL